jgi:hypothetical protein
MGNKLLMDNWGDNSTSYTEEELAAARRKFRRQDIATWVVIVLAAGALAVALML